MDKSGKPFIIVPLSILLAWGAFAQAPPDKITIDVAVLSPSGEPVPGLHQDEFLLYEDDLLQEIQRVESTSLPYRILMIDECTGDPNIPRVFNSIMQDSHGVPFQRALSSFLDVLAGHERVAFAQFGRTLAMQRDWNTTDAAMATIRLRSLKDSFEPDCRVDPGKTAEHSFLEKLSWIESKLEGVRGRKAVVWFGPPKNLGSFVADPPLVLRARGERSSLPNIDDFLEFRTIRERMSRLGAAFYFLLSSEEFSFSLQAFAEQKRRSYEALRNWAEATGGQLLLADSSADVEDLARRLNQEPETEYSLSYHPSPQSEGRYHHVKVSTRNPKLRVLQSQTLYFR